MNYKTFTLAQLHGNCKIEACQHTTVQIPVIEDLSARILAEIKDHPERHDQWSWHSIRGNDQEYFPRGQDPRACGTTHCVAGWAVVVAAELDPSVLQLERDYYTNAVARVLFEAAGEDQPSFQADAPREVIIEDLERNVARKKEIPCP